MLDDGEVAVIGGIENRRIRSKLKELFPLLGLVKVGGFTGKLAWLRANLMLDGERAKVSSEETEPVEEKPAAPKLAKRERPIGPALPPPSEQGGSTIECDDDDDDEVVGPALPGMKGFRMADERVEAEMARKAQELEKEQWERARDGGSTKKADVPGKTPLAREAWMTMMPESSILKDSLGPQNRPLPGKPAAFRRELLGYIREENAPSVAADSSVAASKAQPMVNESILPNANPEADEEMRKQMESLRKARGPSLLEQHQRKQADQAKNEATPTQSSGGWNRFVETLVQAIYALSNGSKFWWNYAENGILRFAEACLETMPNA
ncbi:unnamed protein product [Phytophthora fragariaefolia]|uniref:Unnamed protein product n=1 Tax=Phytophthora fragariaefolia TaxID=1490495 RepID=A0A9W6XBN7_9STRA|nr:unnamed protein product [Phytophthora fragariaefolia]